MMTTAPFPQVTNELLSAYIDEAVGEEERRLIEQAMAEDPDVAWRLESLRATVRLLHELPALSLPRSFVLTPEQVGQTAAAPGAKAFGAAMGSTPETVIGTVPGKTPPPARRQPGEEQGSGFWHDLRRDWGRFWQGGSPALRNAMAASFVVLLTLVIAPRFLANTSFVSPGSVETAASGPQTQTSTQDSATLVASSDVELQNAAPAVEQTTAPTAVQVAKTDPEAAKQGAPTAVTEESGAAASNTTTAGATGSVAATTAVQPTVVPATTFAKPPHDGQAESGRAGTASGPAADGAVAQGGGAPGALAASAPPAAPPGPALAAPSGRSVLDAASAEAGAGAMPPAASARISGGMAEGVTSAPAAGADAEVTAADAATEQAETSVAAAAAPATKLLAEGDTQESLATPVATVASEPAPAEAAEAETQAAPAAVVELAPVDATTAATATSAAAVAEVVADSSSTASDQAANAQTSPAPAAPVAQRGSLPAWIGLGIQTAALLAALATLIFAILWWRSRSPQPRL
jgi:hypothetical protein